MGKHKRSIKNYLPTCSYQQIPLSHFFHKYYETYSILLCVFYCDLMFMNVNVDILNYFWHGDYVGPLQQCLNAKDAYCHFIVLGVIGIEQPLPGPF